MLLLDTVTGNPWKPENANVMLQRIKAEVTTELRARDVSLSGGRINEAGGYKITVPDDAGRLRADHELQRIRHTGRESRLLREKRWTKFCSTPQPQDTIMSELANKGRKARMAAANAAYDAEFTEETGSKETLVVIPEPVTEAPPKRQAGRPFGSKNKPKARGDFQDL